MARLVTLRSPGGVVRAVDPDSFDVQSALRDGFQMVPEGPARDVSRDTGRALSNREVSADIARRFTREAVPSGLAMAASMAAPEVVAPVAGLARIAPWLLRAGAAGVGGAVGDIGAQGLTGEPLDVSKALSRGVGEMAAQGIGEAGVGLATGAAEGLYRGALRPGLKLTKEATRTASRLAQEKVGPDVASLAKQGLRERIPLGRGFTGTGSEKLERIAVPEIAAKTDALKVADRSRWKFNPQRLADGITDLKAEVMGEVGGKDKAALIDQMWADELSKYHNTTYPSGKPRPGAPKINRMSASELDEQVLKWQKQADYSKDAEDPKEALKARVAKALAREGRAHLRAIQTPMRSGATAGEVIAAANDRLSELHPITDAVSQAELRMESGTGGSVFPWYVHAGAPAAGAAIGATGGPGASAGGALLGLAADRALSNPAVASRLALGLSNRGVLGTIRQAPRAAAGAMRFFTPAQRDEVAR